MQQCDRAKNLVIPAGQLPQNTLTVFFVMRLADNITIQFNSSIRSQNRHRFLRLLELRGHYPGLAAGDTADVVLRGLARQHAFIDIGNFHFVFDTDLAQ